MGNIVGTFYFKQNKSGNLLGEFTNNKMNGISTESSDLTSSYQMRFVGTYETTWFEKKTSQNLTLVIDIKKDSDGIYNLTWKKNKSIKFYGIGFITGKRLIGYYTNE